MTRLSTPNADAAGANVVRMAILARLNFASGPLTVSDGYQAIEYNGETYAPLGEFGGFESISERGEFRPEPLQLSLSGVPASRLDDLSPANYQGRDCDVLLALLDAQSALIDAPEPLWSGFMDYASLSVSAGEATITLVCESRIIDFRVPRVSRYTNAEQQNLFPLDTAFEFVSRMADQVLRWGGSRVAAQSAPGPRLPATNNQLR